MFSEELLPFIISRLYICAGSVVPTQQVCSAIMLVFLLVGNH